MPQTNLERVRVAIEQDASELRLEGMSDSSTVEIPEEILSLTKLTVLNLAGCGLKTLPPWFDRLQTLEALDLKGNELNTLPDSLTQLTQLQSLDVSHNSLTALPDSLAQLTQLQSLDVSHNSLTALPDSLARLTKLQSFNACNNWLTALPDSLAQLTELQSLTVWGNRLTTLPDSLAQLIQLQSLDVSHNSLITLPDFLTQLTQLKSLDVASNSLTTLPDSLAKLTELQTLNVWGNSLTTLPDSLAQLTQLQTLDVSTNSLTTLPDSLAQLTQLELLVAAHNSLTTLPDSLAQLTQLVYLVASHNALTALPDSLAQLTQLVFLDASHNSLTTLPESLAQLTQLERLDASNNSLTILPDNLGQLTKLESFNVSNNQLASLPDSMNQLIALRDLDLSANRLETLPSWLQRLPLNDLWLQQNPGLGISTAVLGKYREPSERLGQRVKSPATILEAYFSSRALDGQPLDEVKLVLVGRGSAGKTTLAHRLVRDRFKRGKVETQGVEISRWPLTCGERVIDVNVWDFAGQVVTHSTHQFFLSESSVYVLVLTGREDTQKTDADYWLRLIRAFATDSAGSTSPVIVVLNKFDDHPFKVDRNALREKYPFIAEFIETDCKSGLGVNNLRQRLSEVIWAMPIVQQRFKLAWWRIKEQLEKAQRKHNYLPYSTFQDICAKHGEGDPERQRFLADVFHALGVALNFGNDERLRNATVLNPRWVTESIYKILRTAVADDGSAELTSQRVAGVLPNEPEEMRSYLVELMRRFDLAFPVNEHSRSWLVPQRLPAEQPDLGEEWKALNDATRLRYTYPVIPEGLLPRFISRTYPLSEGEAGAPPLPRWANGVVLQDRGARALVRVDSEERRIDVTCKGPKEERLFLLGVIQADFRTLHEQISGLDQTEELEIEGHLGVYVPVSGMIADERSGQNSSASSIKGTIPFNATKELDRLSEPPARRDEWRPRVFISYSSSDARQKDALLTRLKPMRESQGLVETWDDRCIGPGKDWDGVIRKELAIADVVLLLISPTFLASDYIRGVEVAVAVRRANASEALLIPIILEQCGYVHEPFGRFNALPRKGHPVRDHQPQRNAWYEIESELRQTFMQLQREVRDQETRIGIVQRGIRVRPEGLIARAKYLQRLQKIAPRSK